MILNFIVSHYHYFYLLINYFVILIVLFLFLLEILNHRIYWCISYSHDREGHRWCRGRQRLHIKLGILLIQQATKLSYHGCSLKLILLRLLENREGLGWGKENDIPIKHSLHYLNQLRNY